VQEPQDLAIAALDAARAVEKDADAQGVMDFARAQLRARLGLPEKEPVKAAPKPARRTPAKKSPIKTPSKTPAKKVNR